MKKVDTITSAIAALHERCAALKAQGLEQGSVQRHSNGGYRLVWKDKATGKVRAGRILAPDQIEPMREAHKRYLLYKRLQTKIRKLEESMGAIAQLDASIDEEGDAA